MKLAAILTVLLVAIQPINSVANYKKVVLTNPEALCLDGTPGAYYVH